MITAAAKTSLSEAAVIHFISCKESHRSFCYLRMGFEKNRKKSPIADGLDEIEFALTNLSG